MSCYKDIDCETYSDIMRRVREVDGKQVEDCVAAAIELKSLNLMFEYLKVLARLLGDILTWLIIKPVCGYSTYWLVQYGSLR